MSTPKIIADFETQLSAAISVGDTTFTMSSATDDDGIALPDGLYYFTLDNGSTNKQYMAGTLSGTTVSSAVNVSRQGVESSGSTKAHRVGATVIMTDFMTYKKYMDEISLVSAPDASVSTKGVIEVGTTAEINADTATGGSGADLAVTPSKLGASIYKTQLPSADQKAALAGSEGTPSDTNTFVTEEGLAAQAPPQVVVFTSSGTWTKDAGLKYVVVEVQAGGGTGGQGSSNQNGASGASGGYSRKLILASELGDTETVTVGAVAGNSSFGSHVLTYGGATASGSVAGAVGAVPTGGDINIPGLAGETGLSNDNGGSSSEYRRPSATPSFFGSGGYGAGGKGETQATGNETAGIAGVTIVTEYYA